MSKLTEKLRITTGPWSTNLNDYHDLCIYDVKGKWIANVVEKKEDAQLIAAAPELLESLIDLLTDALNTRRQTHGDFRGGPEKYYSEDIKVIEEATDKSWQEIKQLIGE